MLDIWIYLIRSILNHLKNSIRWCWTHPVISRLLCYCSFRVSGAWQSRIRRANRLLSKLFLLLGLTVIRASRIPIISPMLYDLRIDPLFYRRLLLSIKGSGRSLILYASLFEGGSIRILIDHRKRGGLHKSKNIGCWTRTANLWEEIRQQLM